MRQPSPDLDDNNGFQLPDARGVEDRGFTTVNAPSAMNKKRSSESEDNGNSASKRSKTTDYVRRDILGRVIREPVGSDVRRNSKQRQSEEPDVEEDDEDEDEDEDEEGDE